MVTVVNQSPDNDSNLGTVVAVVLVILIILAILFWSGPIIRRFGATSTPSITETSAPNKVDINVNNGSDSTNQQTQTMQPSAQPQTTLAPNPTNGVQPTPTPY